MSMNKYPVVIGGVGLVKGRIKNIGLAMAKVCEEVKPLIDESNAYEEMPFQEINMIIRWANESVAKPEIGPLRKSKGVLEVATTISLKDGKKVENCPRDLESLVREELRKVFVAVGEKYGLHRIDI